jgi:penicillin-binding protein 2
MPGTVHDGRLGAANEPTSERRIAVVAIGIIFAFSIFVLRLFQLQILDGADLRDRSRRNSVRSVRVEAPRGEIVDRFGRVIATARPAFQVQLSPSDLRDSERTYRALGLLLDRSPEELERAVGKPVGRSRFQPVVLDGDLPYETLAGVESHRFSLPGVVTDRRPRRHYLDNALVGHLLGSLGEIQPSQLEREDFVNYRSGDFVGQGGVEKRFESHLRGRMGGRNAIVDVMGREIEEIGRVDPVPGGRVVLTIDLDLQRAAAEGLLSADPEKPDLMGAVVVLDPRNGDILALVSKPGFDPNSFAGGIDGETWAQLTTDEWEPLTNRAISGLYSPGSTYKAIVAAAGLAEGRIDPNETVYCPGFYRLGRRAYRCWKRVGHGDMNFIDALKHSCDVYFYALGVELGIDTIARYARGFGLGLSTGIRLPGEETGLIPTREWKERVKHEEWIKGETVSASIGQGFNLVSPLQLAVAYAALGNGGTRYVPRLLKRLETWDGEVVFEQEVEVQGHVPVSRELLDVVKQGLIAVVMGERGTGAAARVEGIEIAGKTGTTQVVGLERVKDLEDDEIPVRWRDHALFASFAPAHEPEIAIAVLVEHAGGGGGRIAAPIARNIFAKYFEKRSQEIGEHANDVAAVDPPAVSTGLDSGEPRDDD